LRLRQQLDPRLHVAAAIGWAVFAVVTLAALVAANGAAAEAEQRARADAEALLAELATQVRDAVSMHLETRRSLLQAKAAQITASADAGTDALLRTLDALQTPFPEFVWLGVADGRGRLVGNTGGGRRGEDVSAQTWFQQGRLHSHVGDVQAPQPGSVAAPRWLDFAVPLPGPAGQPDGVLAAHVAWPWVEAVVMKMQRALNQRRQIEVLLAARDGTVLLGPPGWPGRRYGPEADITEGGAWVVGQRTELRLADGLGLGWTAIVRQGADAALAPVRTTRRNVFVTVFVAGLLAAVAAAFVTRVLTRRLTRLAADAEAVRRGQQRALAVPPGVDEVSRIGATLAQVVDHLQTEKQALQDLNAELDRRVAERTARIERMADEARHAAVTRERLRIARDLHDTLAHSLMALLTQIRLVRKLRDRLDAQALDAELARAEEVAGTGLVGARATIAQMRDHGVRDTGLGAALQDLLRRHGQRTGHAVTLQADAAATAWAAGWADERAETVVRILEEALRNVERHASASTVQLTLACAGAGADAGPGAPRPVHIELADDGCGFDPTPPRPGHYGLLGMQEQAALIGARLGVHSAPGQGTRIALDFGA
jgi:signal transduction histidine kinase